MSVKVTATYEPDDNEVDGDDPTGLTAKAYDELTEQLMALGFDNIDVVG